METADDFIAKFAEQAAMIKATPYPFIMAVAIATAAVWVIVNYVYRTTILSKDAQLELANRQIADYKQKLDGASPDGAKARIDALEKEVANLKKISGRTFLRKNQQ